jgi:PTH1 family peptidyl-tRNA hydrolase
MWLIVGLGNPGTKYMLNRHNIGFMAVDRLAASLNAPSPKQQSKSELYKFQWDGRPVLLAKPQTYMNLSGESIRALVDFYKVEAANILVLHDDIDQSFPQMKFQKQRGHGGHNGIKSLVQHLGHNDFTRLKIGVGRPDNTSNIPVADYVLQDFSREEQSRLDLVLDRAAEAVECFVFEGFERASGQFNQKWPWPPSS